MSQTGSPHWGSTLEEFLDEEGIREEATTGAIKRVIAWQLAEEMKRKSITKARLADLMHTSRAQVNRILDPDKGNVTIETLQRAAHLLGRTVKLHVQIESPIRLQGYVSSELSHFVGGKTNASIPLTKEDALESR
jgi:antitoxin HicB